MEEKMIRRDGLTSIHRKEKYSTDKLKKMALRAKKFYTFFGWRVLGESELDELEHGQKIRCCAWACGCFGQVETIDRAYGFFRHTNHEVSFAYGADSPGNGFSDRPIFAAFSGNAILVRRGWNRGS
jgi:hypothetical protein